MKTIHVNKMITIVIWLISGLFFSDQSSLSAQRNRYGMSLSGEKGNYTLLDAAKICPLVDGGCKTLPLDAYETYTYKPQRISNHDYVHCTTLKYVFRTYSSHELHMEVDIPKLSNGPHPFIIWVHGGGWVNGSANAFKKQSAYLASRGIAGVRITYSLISQGGHFDQGMQELADAFDFIKKHAVEWKLDITSFGYAGGSAGTPLAALTALKHNGNGCRLFIGCNGIYDFEDNLSGNFGSRPSPYLKKYNKKSDRGVISAINYIADKPKNTPAVAVFHGKADFTISYLQSVAFCDSIIKKGGHAEKYIYDLYVHSFFNRGASDMFEDVTMNMYTFAKSVFRMHDVIIPQQNNSVVIARSVNQ